MASTGDYITTSWQGLNLGQESFPPPSGECATNTPSVPLAIGLLGKSIEELQELLGALEMRMQPVLLRANTEIPSMRNGSTVKDLPRAPYNVPLADQIQMLEIHVEQIQSFVKDILLRLGI